MNKWIIRTIYFCLLTGICAIGWITVTATENKEPVQLVVAIPFTGIAREDVQLVEDEINKITKRELNITVKFPKLSTSTNYYYDATAMLSSPEQLDIMVGGFGSFMECYVDKKLLPLDNLLERYGQDIIQQVGEEKIHYCDIYDALYGIPINGNYTQQANCYALRKDILDKYNICPDDIKTEEDLENVFAFIHEKEPEMLILDSGSTRASEHTMLSNQFFLDTGTGTVPLTSNMDYGREKKLVSTFTSEEYMNALKRVRQWYLKGYIDEDIYGRTKSLTDRLQSGEVFGYTTKKLWNNSDNNIIWNGSVELALISLDEEVLNYNGYSSMPYVITANTVSAEASMKLLNLLYSSEDIENLLCYGVEGIHYKKTSDGHITFVNEKKYNPFLRNNYNMPNQYITHVWEGKELDFWEQVKKKNETAIQSCRMGFNFDYSNVDAEYNQVNEIYQEYKWILENGMENPEFALNEMLEEMERGGLDLILREEQAQYDAWQKNREEEEHESVNFR